MQTTTPETDAFTTSFTSIDDPEGNKRWVPSEFARVLERERDEARERAAKWESSFDAMERAGAEQARRADENREWALRAERERDEAREELNNIRLNLGEDAEGYTLLHAVAALQNERDELHYKLQDAKQSLEVALQELSSTNK